jgi:hypothetical protein
MQNKHAPIIGIDTHKSIHVAVAIDNKGTRLSALSIPAKSKGYLELERWSCGLDPFQAFGIEGTGSYGAWLSRSSLAQGHNVIEITRPNRQLRYSNEILTAWMQRGRTIRSIRPGNSTASDTNRVVRDNPTFEDCA